MPARIWLPPFAEPIAVHSPPLMSQEVNMIGMAIAKSLDERGLSGATHMGTGYDAWYPGYIDYMPIFKNIPAFWTETAGNGAAPRQYTLDDIPANLRTPKPLYPNPWLGGWWRLGDTAAVAPTALQHLHMDPPHPVPGVHRIVSHQRYLTARQRRARQRLPRAVALRQGQRAVGTPGEGADSLAQLSRREQGEREDQQSPGARFESPAGAPPRECDCCRDGHRHRGRGEMQPGVGERLAVREEVHGYEDEGDRREPGREHDERSAGQAQAIR